MGIFSKKQRKPSYDPARYKPVIRCSICTGEQTAGFKDLSSGSFKEVALIRTQRDLDEFCKRYGITEKVEKIY